MAQADTLLIFDYSGTLSLEMPRFARAENLLRALVESGLEAVGVSTPEIFWEEIVNATWIEGSTTQAGYKRVMAERIAALGRASGAASEEIAAAASRFVDSYLAHARIEPGWRPLLTRLSENPDVVVSIATDHYAEATGRIVAELEAWGIPAVKTGSTPASHPEGGSDAPSPPMAPAARVPGSPRAPRDAAMRSAPPCRRPFFVANSADIGSWKVDARFWEAVQEALPRELTWRLLVVDDFGFNEVAGDSYGGEAARIAARKEQTRVTLRDVFGVEAEIVPFFLEERHGGGATGRARLIAETALRIENFLKRQ